MSPETQAIIEKAKEVLERQRALAERATDLQLKARVMIEQLRSSNQEKRSDENGEPERPTESQLQMQSGETAPLLGGDQDDTPLPEPDPER